MRRYIFVIAVAVALSFLSGVRAQSATGHIRGVIRDMAGSVLPGAEVTLSDGTRVVRRTQSDAHGEFVFLRLQPGRYTVTAALAGFKRTMMAVQVGTGVTRDLSFAIALGTLEETVTVAESPAARSEGHELADGVAPGVSAGVAGGVVRGLASAPSVARFARPTFNTEAYDKIDDNQWTEVARKPLSTFSIDVDTASYSNVRRFLNQAQLPPKDAVRVEELINYFSYDYAEPQGATPFSVTTALSECPWNSRHLVALVGLQAKHLDRRSTPPRNLVFLIDVSGSMQTPEKLPLVKASLAMLARNLTDKDRIAIVVYAGAAGLVLPSTFGSDTTTILEALGRLEAGGSTNGAQGLLLAYRVAADRFVKGGVNRVVLATDGDFNVGVTNQGDLIRLIEEQRETGIALSVLGFGMGNLKDSTLEKLADKGNGNYAYIDTLAEAQKVLVQEAGGTLVTVAKDVKLQIEFDPRTVAAYRLIGYENRVLQDQDFNNDRKDAGDLGAGHSVTALYEIVPAGQPIDVPGIDPLKYQRPGMLSPDAAREEAMTVKLRYKRPDAETSSLISMPVPATPAISPALGFAAAVAELGMLLRNSEYKGSSSYDDALTLARKFKGQDPHGHRAEFIRLIGIAESVSRLHDVGR